MCFSLRKPWSPRLGVTARRISRCVYLDIRSCIRLEHFGLLGSYLGTGTGTGVEGRDPAGS